MQAERRLFLAALLLSVAQQEPENVKWLGLRKTQATHLSKVISQEARLFVESEGFEEMCDRIDIEPSRLRALSPAQAFDSYNKITADDWQQSVGEEFDAN